jgi:MFS family permease
MTFYTGAFYGYGPFQLMLEETGAFSSRCTPGEQLPCPSQTAMLLNVQFISMLTMIFTPFMGAGIDKYGPALMFDVAFVIGGLGLVLLILSTSLHIDPLLFPSFICLGFMSCLTGLYTVQTGQLFKEGRDRNRVISILNALLDSGAVTYLLLWYVETNTIMTLPTISAVYLAFYILVVGTSVICWTRIGKNTQRLSTEEMDTAVHERTAEIEHQESIDDDEEPTSTNQYILIANRPQRQQLLSSQYITLCILFAFHQARNTFILTTTRDFLKYLGDDEYGNKYLSIFTLLTPVSVLGLPFVDVILHKFGYAAGLHACNMLGICQGIVQVSSTNLSVQILGFVFYSFYRCFLFSVTFSALAAFLRGDVLGKGCGIFILSGGLLGLAFNIPLANVAMNSLGGNFFIPNLVYLLGCLPCTFLCYQVGRGFAKEATKKKEEIGLDLDRKQ